MSSLPKFHTKAVEEAEGRFKSARGERDKAESFLDALDDILADVVPQAAVEQ